MRCIIPSSNPSLESIDFLWRDPLLAEGASSHGRRFHDPVHGYGSEIMDVCRLISVDLGQVHLEPAETRSYISLIPAPENHEVMAVNHSLLDVSSTSDLSSVTEPNGFSSSIELPDIQSSCTLAGYDVENQDPSLFLGDSSNVEVRGSLSSN